MSRLQAQSQNRRKLFIFLIQQTIYSKTRQKNQIRYGLDIVGQWGRSRDKKSGGLGYEEGRKEHQDVSSVVLQRLKKSTQRSGGKHEQGKILREKYKLGQTRQPVQKAKPASFRN